MSTPRDDPNGSHRRAVTVGRALDEWGADLDRKLRWLTLGLAVTVGILVVASVQYWAGNVAGAPVGTAAPAIACYLLGIALCVAAGWLSLRVVGRHGDLLTWVGALASAVLPFLGAAVAGVARDLLGSG